MPTLVGLPNNMLFLRIDIFAYLCKYTNMDLKKLSTLFKALADENRLSLIGHLCNCRSTGCSANVGELSNCCDIDFSVVSLHLSKLKSEGVLRAHKEGKEVFYTLNGKELAQELRQLADILESSCCPTKETT